MCLRKLKIELPYDPVIPYVAYIRWKTRSKEIHAPQCSQQNKTIHNSQDMETIQDMYVCIYIYTHTHTYIYIYIYIHNGTNHRKEWNNAICSNIEDLVGRTDTNVERVRQIWQRQVFPHFLSFHSRLTAGCTSGKRGHSMGVAWTQKAGRARSPCAKTPSQRGDSLITKTAALW